MRIACLYRTQTRRRGFSSRWKQLQFQHIFLLTMSEKIKEFVEVPQQFVREGNQVSLLHSSSCLIFLSTSFEQFLARCTKPSWKGSYSVSRFHDPDLNIPPRIHPNFKSCRCWICSYGLHRLLCEANSHSYVSFVRLAVVPRLTSSPSLT